MMIVSAFGWLFALMALTGAAVFFWRGQKIAGFAFSIVFMVVLASTAEKRIVLHSAMLGITLESDRGQPRPNP
jgi:hypothetical protein